MCFSVFFSITYLLCNCCLTNLATYCSTQKSPVHRATRNIISPIRNILFLPSFGISVSFNIAASFRKIHNNLGKVRIVVKISAVNYLREFLYCASEEKRFEYFKIVCCEHTPENIKRMCTKVTRKDEF